MAGGGEDRSMLLELGGRLGLRCSDQLESALGSDVIFMGHRKDVQRLICESDIVLLPSLFEGYPLTLVEALCLGAKVISSDCSTGPAEISKELNSLLLTKSGKKMLNFNLLPSKFEESDLNAWNCEIEKMLTISTDSSALQKELICQYFSRSLYHTRWRELLIRYKDCR